MKLSLAVFALFLGLSTLAFSQDAYPVRPDPGLTPGSLCHDPDSYRYPEQIPYCSRNVSTNEKNEVIHNYETQLGYRILETGRQHFKIDHYIPLCMGGSNEYDNLWPQHESVYTVTDSLEELSCKQMEAGKLKQDEAVKLIREAKNDLSQVPRILDYIRNL